MRNDSRTRIDSVVRSDEKETIQKISEVILDSRDILEKKAPSQDDAEVAFDRIAGCIRDLCTRGIVPKRDGTTTERRMGQLISLASEFDETFELKPNYEARGTGRDLNFAMVLVAGYRFGRQEQPELQDAHLANTPSPCQAVVPTIVPPSASARASTSTSTASGVKRRKGLSALRRRSMMNDELTGSEHELEEFNIEESTSGMGTKRRLMHRKAVSTLMRRSSSGDTITAARTGTSSKSGTRVAKARATISRPNVQTIRSYRDGDYKVTLAKGRDGKTLTREYVGGGED